MKTLITLLGFILCFQLSAQDFEGTIQMEMDAPDMEKDMEMTFHVKGDQFAVLISDPSQDEVGNMRMIINKEANEMLMIIEGDQESMAMKYDLAVMQEMQNKLGELAPDGDTENAEITAEKPGKFTGKTKEIDGFTCKEYIVKEDGQLIQMWINEEININYDEMFPSQPGAKSDNPFSRANGPDGFPMELTATDEKTGETMTMKSKVTREKIDDEIFAVPEGIEIMDMTFMLQMMQGQE